MNERDRRVLYDDLAAVHEVAQALGVNVHRVRRWIERRAAVNCPQPVRELKGIHIYSLADWRGWYALWRVTRGSETWKRDSDSI